MSGQGLVAARGAISGSGEDIISTKFQISLVACLIHQLIMVSHLDIVEAFKVQGRYGGDATMNEINVLDMNSTLVPIRQ